MALRKATQGFVTKLAVIVVSMLLTSTVLTNELENNDSSKQAIEIIKLMEDLYRGEASIATIIMTVETPHYKRTMKMTSQNLGDEKSLIRILSPKKDRGISTLKRGREMWNYFPKINKVIKIPPSMMMGAWMGSDFTNDDLVKQSQLTEEYRLSMSVSDETYEITLTPKEETVTVWGKISYTINRADMLPISQDYFDDRGKLIRTLSFESAKLFAGRKLPAMLVMTPLNKSGHRTVIEYQSLTFEPDGISEANFSLRSLKSRF